MRKIKRRWIGLGLALAVLLVVPAAVWVGLNHRPAFYRTIEAMPRARRQAEAQRFASQSLQLYNDIVNEPTWEAAFTDEEVNAWLAEHLVAHFADQVPPGVHEPRVAFEPGRLTLAFQLDDGPVRSVVWAVVRVRVPEANTLALTLEKVRAGVVPIPAERITGPITAHARRHGLDVRWEHDGHLPMALVRYTPDLRRADVVLERLDVSEGRIRLSGRSNRRRGSIAAPTLPTRRALQSTFPRRSDQPVPVSLRDNSASPRS